MKTKKRILTYGTFDLFHIGHLNLLKRLRSLGDELYVGISSDEFNQQKGKTSLIPYEHRAEIVSSIIYVDKVFKEESREQKIHDIQKYDIAIFAMGSDWKNKFDFLNEYCVVKYLERTEGISSTSLRNTLNIFSSINKEEILNAFKVLEKLKEDLA
jgi:glycerol-3-phosphate cytidylyltransferase